MNSDWSHIHESNRFFWSQVGVNCPSLESVAQTLREETTRIVVGLETLDQLDAVGFSESARQLTTRLRTLLVHVNRLVQIQRRILNCHALSKMSSVVSHIVRKNLPHLADTREAILLGDPEYGSLRKALDSLEDVKGFLESLLGGLEIPLLVQQSVSKRLEGEDSVRH